MTKLREQFKSAEYMIQYLGRYTHRVAISNNRIISCENGFVTYKWRDYRDKNKEKLMTLSTEEFIRRFMLKITGKDIPKCPCCGSGIMKRKSNLQPTVCSPPMKIKTA